MVRSGVQGMRPASCSRSASTSIACGTPRRGISLEEAQTRRDPGIPLRRQADGLEVAEAFLCLASPASSYVTGIWLDVNGGVVLR